MLIESSQDILWLTIALCIFLFTVFSCWILYYIATILREGKRAVVDVRKKFELLESILIAFKEKISHTSSYLKLLVEGAETVTHFVKGRKEEKKATPKKRGRKKKEK